MLVISQCNLIRLYWIYIGTEWEFDDQKGIVNLEKFEHTVKCNFEQISKNMTFYQLLIADNIDVATHNS